MSLKKLEAALKNAPNKLVKNRIKKAINIYTELGDKRLAKDMLGTVIEKSIFSKIIIFNFYLVLYYCNFFISH